VSVSIAQLTVDKATIHAALKVMGSDSNEAAVSLGIQIAAFSRTILEVLRDADEPLTVRGIALGREGTGRAGAGSRGRQGQDAVSRMSEQLEGELRGRATHWCVRSPGTKC
jgi:hypothetical protein